MNLGVILVFMVNGKWNSNTIMCAVELSREPSPNEDGVPTAEEATEATEEEGEAAGTDTSQPGIYTEHVFTDPLGVQPAERSTATDNVR